MPIPKPRAGEGESDFHGRCMGDDTMVSEYPDSDQRNAICSSAWDNRNKSFEKPLSVGGTTKKKGAV